MVRKIAGNEVDNPIFYIINFPTIKLNLDLNFLHEFRLLEKK